MAIEILARISDTRYQLSFYLRRIGPMINRCKVPKYYDQDPILDKIFRTK